LAHEPNASDVALYRFAQDPTPIGLIADRDVNLVSVLVCDRAWFHAVRRH
jgi:hypothetical protein